MNTFFIQGHTSEGNFHLLSQFWKGNDVWVISGGNMELRGSILSKIATSLAEEKVNFDQFVHPNNGSTLDGLFIKDKKLLLLSDNGPLYPGSRFKGLVNKVIELNSCLMDGKIQHNIIEIADIIRKMDHQRNSAYSCFKNGRMIHEKKEALYLEGMDFLKADEVADELISHWISTVEVKDANPNVSQRFFGAATAFGPMDFIDDITEGLQHRIIIKGRSGSGKSTLMRKIGEVVEKKQLSVQYFPCGLDPNSLDMLIVPSLQFAIIDGTAPHVINPSRPGDQVVDMFERCMNPEVEKAYKEILESIDEEYKLMMKTGTKYLQRVDELEKEIHIFFDQAIQREELTKLEKQLQDMIHQKK